MVRYENIYKVKIVFSNLLVLLFKKTGLKKRYTQLEIKVLNNIDLLVVSPGGVGTTVFMDHCKKYLKINESDNSDGLKHKFKPFTKYKKELKIIYIGGNSQDIYSSLIRRSYFQIQLLNLESFLGVISSRLIDIQKFNKLLKIHKQNWINTHHENIMFLEYENLFESSEKVMNYLNINEPSFVETFPKRQSRTNS